ncbi:hypothetical protein BDZ89DRAFT_917653, partial [Hymenopellis radicata]
RGDDSSKDAVVAYTRCAFGVLFDGLYCLAWNSPFPTVMESHLWRTSALMVTICSVAVYIHPASTILVHWLGGFFSFFLIMRPHFFIPFVYVFARLSLVTLSVTALRTLPFSVYLTVQWISSIPHV